MWGGEGWDVTDPKERIQAAEWFSKVACEFEQWLEAQLETEVADAIERHESGVSTRRGPQPGAEGDPEGIGFDMAGYV